MPTRLALAVRRSEPRIECYVAYLDKTSSVSSVDVARAVAAILDNPTPRIGHIYDLTGPESADLDHYARVFSEALGRTIPITTRQLRSGAKNFGRQACRSMSSTTSR